jgi:YD repeat-containing protein
LCSASLRHAIYDLSPAQAHGGQLRKYKYDGLGRVLFERIPERTATINNGTGTMWTSKFTYTDFNAVATRTDARGAVATYGYDTLNRLTTVSYNVSSAPGVASTPSVTYIYDNNQASATTGLLTSIQVGGGASVVGGSEENYLYDLLGRASSLTRRINVSPSVIRNYATGYLYNDASQMTQFTYPSGRVLNPTYDSKGRFYSILSYLSSVTYDTIGRVSGMTLGNGVVESFTYDPQRMQLTSQTATKSGQTRLSLTYGFQAAAGQMGAGNTAGNAGQLI